MAFGIPGSETGGEGGDFLPRLKFDARVGMWQRVERQQGSDGVWASHEEDLLNPSFVADFRSLEVGYCKFTSPPAFVLVPYGDRVPPQPDEMADKKKAFQPGFRLKVLLAPKRGLHALTNSSKTLMEAMDQLHQQFLSAREAEAGQIPVVAVNGKLPIEKKTPQGKSTFYAPKFEITGWVDRPDIFGEAIVPVPSALGAVYQAKAPAAEQVSRPVPRHVPPPTPKPAMATAGGDDDLPF